MPSCSLASRGRRSRNIVAVSRGIMTDGVTVQIMDRADGMLDKLEEIFVKQTKRGCVQECLGAAPQRPADC